MAALGIQRRNVSSVVLLCIEVGPFQRTSVVIVSAQPFQFDGGSRSYAAMFGSEKQASTHPSLATAAFEGVGTAMVRGGRLVFSCYAVPMRFYSRASLRDEYGAAYGRFTCSHASSRLGQATSY